MWPMVSMMKHFNSMPHCISWCVTSRDWKMTISRFLLCFACPLAKCIYAPHEHQSRRLSNWIYCVDACHSNRTIYFYWHVFFSLTCFGHINCFEQQQQQQPEKKKLFKYTIIVKWWKCCPFFVCLLCSGFWVNSSEMSVSVIGNWHRYALHMLYV